MSTILARFILIAINLFPLSALAAEGSWLVKVPYASKHFGSNQEFNETNWGAGLGYLFHDVRTPGIGLAEVAVTGVLYKDSYGCTGSNLQLRSVKQFDRFGAGLSLNLAHKCFNPKKQMQVKVFPTFTGTWEVTENVTAVGDFVPKMGRLNQIGVLALSLEWRF